MCAGCAMVAVSAASGLRTWLQNHQIGWLTPRRLRALTIAAMCAAGLLSTVGISGSSTPAAVNHTPRAAAYRAVPASTAPDSGRAVP